ncbi:hypothetical protein IT6_00355 [Methylacidiphilum caldifontis]|uniref:hypothetical protein n=1 Tax=Methylacidiphilum caldifontis TaxID=2795386 RepID=UPI001A8FD63E|nr:hypothetical protein [Methylacidiphilum caldifontis]QSR88800.1 hypothetical protein IT6_00355 [Methylacidiphilum caldifontis]
MIWSEAYSYSQLYNNTTIGRVGNRNLFLFRMGNITQGSIGNENVFMLDFPPTRPSYVDIPITRPYINTTIGRIGNSNLFLFRMGNITQGSVGNQNIFMLDFPFTQSSYVDIPITKTRFPLSTRSSSEYGYNNSFSEPISTQRINSLLDEDSFSEDWDDDGW